MLLEADEADAAALHHADTDELKGGVGAIAEGFRSASPPQC